MSDLTTAGLETVEKGGLTSSLRRAVRVFYSPTQVFEEVEKRPSWLVPLIICVLVAAISTWILLPTVILPPQREALENRPGITEQQLESARSWLEGSRPLYLGLATSTVFTAIVFLVVAGVFHLVCASLLGGHANFARTFSVVVYSSLVVVPESIVKIPIQLLTKRTEALTSLALLVSAPGASSGFAYRFLYRFLDHIDVFAIWKLVLMGIGLALMFKFARRKAYYVVGTLWLIYALGSSVLSAIVPRSMG